MNPSCPADDDGDDPLSSIFGTGPTPQPAEKAVVFQAPAAEPLLSSSSSNSNCRGAPRAGEAGGARAHAQGAAATPTPGASRARTSPLPRSSGTSTPSLKRATREGAAGSRLAITRMRIAQLVRVELS